MAKKFRQGVRQLSKKKSFHFEKIEKSVLIAYLVAHFTHPFVVEHFGQHNDFLIVEQNQ